MCQEWSCRMYEPIDSNETVDFEEIFLSTEAHSHSIEQGDICPLFQTEWIKDNAMNLLKFAPLAHRAWTAILIACKPFSSQGEQTNGSPDSVKTSCSVGIQDECVNDEQYASKDVDGLVQK